MDDLKMIKKLYGEEMMHLCRLLFPTILETPGLLYSLLEANFAPSRYLYEDLIKNGIEAEFKNYIYGLVDVSKGKAEIAKTPKDLLDEAGYTLYECYTQEDILNFKKYYARGESLCTFHDERLNRCYVFFAVKKNVDEIRREDFDNPEREDEYGTSVISIQFTRGQVNTLSIKNRYNHRVKNPDATFSNNLDNIIPGLTDSFGRVYGLNINQNEGNGFEIPGYVKANDGKYYKYNYELMNVYYCPDNIIIDNFEVIRDYQEKEKYLVIDYFVIDLVKKEVRLHDKRIKDSFVDGLHGIKKIEVVREKDTGGKIITITPNEGSEIIIRTDKLGRIIGYKNNNLIEIGDSFLSSNETLMNIEMNNLRMIGYAFLVFNTDLEDMILPSVNMIGDYCLQSNKLIKVLDLPELYSVGHYFLTRAKALEIVNLPKLSIYGSRGFMSSSHFKNLFIGDEKEKGRK